MSAVFARQSLVIALLAAAVGAGEASPIVDRHAAYQQRLAKVAIDDAAGWYQLAQWCALQQLADEQRQALEKTLALDPEHALARQALGHEKVAGRWLGGPELYQAKGWTKHLGRWMAPAEVAKAQARLAQYREMARKRSDWANAWELNTKHFTIRSNAAPRVVEEMGQAMEACVETLAQIFQPAGQLPTIPLEIYGTQQQFMQGSAKAGIPVQPGVLGYFSTNGRSSIIRCFYAGSIERTLTVLFHECTHLLIRLAYRQGVPLWSNEGMAVFMEYAERQDRKLNIISVPFDRLWQLQAQIKGGGVSLNRLVGARPGGYPAQLYPQGWALTYYLLYADGGKYRNRLKAFYEKTPRPADPVADFAASFGMTPDELMKDWKAYFENLEPRNVDEQMSAALAAVHYRGNAERGLAYAAAAVAKAPGDWRTGLCRARVQLATALLAGAPPAAFATAAAGFDQAAPSRPKFTKGEKPLRELFIDIDHALAWAGAGRYERALELAHAVIAEDDLNAAGYRLIAHILATASDPAVRDLAAAKVALQIADDFGLGPENEHVRALIAAAEGRRDEALKLLQTATAQSTFGFGAHWYRAEAARIARGGGEGGQAAPRGPEKPEKTK